MRRAVLLALVVAMLAGAGTAVAEDGFYMGLGMSGGGQTDLHPYWYGPDTYDGDPANQYWYLLDTNSGIFDYTEMTFGYRTGAMAGELSFGYSRSSWFEEWDNSGRADNEWTESVSRYTLGLTGLYTMIEPDPIELDLGLRFRLQAVKWDEEQTDSGGERVEYEEEEGISGWSIGPVIRARWYLGDGAFAIGPEIYPNYTSMSYKYDHSSYTEPYEADITMMNVEYSFRAEFFF